MEQGYNSVLELAIDELTIVVFELRDRITILENPNPELVDGDPED